MRILFIDTETNGLPRRGMSFYDGKAWPRMVQAAWIVADERGTVLKQANHLIRPEGFEIPEDSVRIHGITTAHALAHGKPLAEVLDELALDLKTVDLFVAHNVAFDRPVLQAEYIHEFGGEPLSRMRAFCTMEHCPDIEGLPKNHAGGRKWPKLIELHDCLFQGGFVGAHDAAEDVAACMRCFFALVERGHMAMPSMPETQVILNVTALGAPSSTEIPA